MCTLDQILHPFASSRSVEGPSAFRGISKMALCAEEVTTTNIAFKAYALKSCSICVCMCICYETALDNSGENTN